MNEIVGLPLKFLIEKGPGQQDDSLLSVYHLFHRFFYEDKYTIIISSLN